MIQAWFSRAHYKLGRYRCQHDQILKSLAIPASGDGQVLKNLPDNHQLCQGLKKPKTATRQASWAGKGWQLDLECHIKLPGQVVNTTLRPEIVLRSELTKQVLVSELTIPWEDCLEEAFERKLAKVWEASEQLSISGELSVSQLRLAAGALQPDFYLEPSATGALKEGRSIQTSTMLLKQAVAEERRAMGSRIAK